MKLATRYLPMGALPYDNIEATTRMAAKLFTKIPFLPTLPQISQDDNIVRRTLDNIPGIIFRDNKIGIKASGENYQKSLTALESAFNNPTKEALEPFAINAVFMYKYMSLIKKFKSPNAIINLLGPFTISQMILNAAAEQMLTDKSYRKLFIQSVCIKALWAIKAIKEANPETVPIIMLEEPLLGRLGDLKREHEDITIELVCSLISRVVEKLKENGAIVGIHCTDKCDWQVPIKAGVDIISFDAYNNPNNLCIIPDIIAEFIAKGGKINWCIIPVSSVDKVKFFNMDQIKKRLFATFEGLILAGVSAPMVYNSALVSLQGDTDKLPVIFAEKALMNIEKLADRIPMLE